MKKMYWLTSKNCLQRLACVIITLVYSSINFAEPERACKDIEKLNLPSSAYITMAGVTPSYFEPPSSNIDLMSGAKVDSPFCRVRGVIAPAIHFEIWLPLTQLWNGKLHAVGNGGMAGSINYTSLKNVVEKGYAGVSSDLGHISGGVEGRWAIARPDLIEDWGYRSTHEMSEIAKLVITDFYGRKPAYSYYSGCSGGGRQGLMQAQMFPEDFDGILIGNPTIDFSNLVVGGRLWQVLANLNKANHTNYLTKADIELISQEVVIQCDAKDGVEDGVLEDPRQCGFQPEFLKCKKGEKENCLSSEQIGALEKIYQGAITSTGKKVYPGYLPGGELGKYGWVSYFAEQEPSEGLQWNYAKGFLQGMVYEDTTYDMLTFNYDTDVMNMNQKQLQGKILEKAINATSPNLTVFEEKGGKIIHYHGWSDIGVSALRSIQYYEDVADHFRDDNSDVETFAIQDFYRLFMVPGMQHCIGGPGPNAFGGSFQPKVPFDPQFDIFKALERWVEQKIAPGQVMATKFIDDNPAKGVQRTRPLCPYPKKAVYTGVGSTDAAQNFICK